MNEVVVVLPQLLYNEQQIKDGIESAVREELLRLRLDPEVALQSALDINVSVVSSLCAVTDAVPTYELLHTATEITELVIRISKSNVLERLHELGQVTDLPYRNMYRDEIADAFLHMATDADFDVPEDLDSYVLIDEHGIETQCLRRYKEYVMLYDFDRERGGHPSEHYPRIKITLAPKESK